jgi:hypothetical protein
MTPFVDMAHATRVECVRSLQHSTMCSNIAAPEPFVHPEHQNDGGELTQIASATRLLRLHQRCGSSLLK